MTLISMRLIRECLKTAFNGHIEIVRLMLAQDANDFNSTMSNATHNGHESIVQLMLEKGAGNFVVGNAYSIKKRS